MNDHLARAIEAVKSGNRDEARKILIAILKAEPNNELAWQWMYNVANTSKEKEDCLKQILRINPQNAKAIELLKNFQSAPQQPIPQPPIFQTSSAPPVTPKKPINNTVLIISALALLAVCLCCAVLLNTDNSISDTNSPNIFSTDIEVKYVLTGSARSAMATTTNKTGGTEQNDVSIPWSQTMHVPIGSWVSIIAQNNGSGALTCEIWVNGEKIKTSTSNTQYGIVTCSDFAH